MEFQKVIEARRSIRKYDENQKVTKEQVEQMVAAAIEAPTWKNSQTARYYCVLSEEMLAKVKSECLPEFNAKNSAGASALIITTYKMNESGYNPDHVTATNELGNKWGVYDLGLHNENLILKATDLGLATLIMGIRDADKLREILNIPEEEEIVAAIAVGYASVTGNRPARKTVEEIAHFF